MADLRNLSSEKPVIRAVAGILKRADKILVAQRPEGKPYSGYWEFPGGKIELAESSEAALKRELHEELGITLLEADCLISHQHDYPDKMVYLDVWLVSSFDGEPHGKEDQALRWVTFAEMQQLRLLEGNWAILDKIKNVLNQ